VEQLVALLQRVQVLPPLSGLELRDLVLLDQLQQHLVLLLFSGLELQDQLHQLDHWHH